MEKDVTVKKLLNYYHYERTEDFVFEGHMHEYREFKYVLKGKLETTYENVVLELGEGDCILCEPGAFHREKALENGTEYAIIHFTSDTLPITGRAKVSTLMGNEKILVNLIIDELETENSAGNTKWTHGLDKYNPTVKKLFEALLYKILSSNYIPVFAGGKRSFLYNQAVNYMREHIYEDLTVDGIARQCGVCSTVLKSIFSEFTGHGVGRHFLNMRLEYAKRRLLQNVSVSDVSDELKFSSQAYFTQCFKRECGCTPSEFKKINFKKQ